MNGIRRTATVVACALAAASPGLVAQSKSDVPQRFDSAQVRENAVKRERQGAGLRVGTWLTNLPETSGNTYSTLPALEGYWQKGLDKHLAVETTAGLWGRTERNSSGRVTALTVPLLTAIKLYPATTVEDQLEPYISGAGGISIGVDDETGTTGGLLSGGGSGGTNLVVGIAVRGGAGIEYHAGKAFGLQAAISYQWIHFLNPVGSTQDYKGPLIVGGLSYRFQY